MSATDTTYTAELADFSLDSSNMNLSKLFHPAVTKWFAEQFLEPTPAQAEAWPAIKAGHHTLIAAPTGSGKTLAAFLAAIDDLIGQGLHGRLLRSAGAKKPRPGAAPERGLGAVHTFSPSVASVSA